MIALELQLHQPETRRSQTRLNLLVANGFEEIAASGVRFNKAHVLQRLPEEQAPSVEAFDFEVRLLSADLAQVLYKAKLRKAGEMQSKLSLRSSLWQLNSLGWQMVFHQGTAVLPSTGPV
ncbi:MAG: DUF4440 domain-containing protein [Gammaproteobacteria bacterium]|nr:DUF4440 domain-containing protein [Gammaproteobacteria bacterium]MBU2056657.1 DUF4440 domain-containing protein [Gammaproteobacteria bacterium]MBU2173994.1 DUF4440 domain-containing protein [Gammaproteobacteria bacterium]MBU2247300.1 DUF4440 domain-containing protein [Gammaproteobacteria bacterium]MBU2345004.1 DUF4440 domain-containing protein [Gammaproteobacteria bacterium]